MVVFIDCISIVSVNKIVMNLRNSLTVADFDLAWLPID